MPRAKNRVASREKRKKILKTNKGQFGKRKSCIRTARDAMLRSGQYAYIGRRQRKRNFRSLWITRINAGARLNGLTYKDFIAGLERKGIALNRKILAHLAMHDPEVFKVVVQQVAPESGANVAAV